MVLSMVRDREQTAVLVRHALGDQAHRDAGRVRPRGVEGRRTYLS